jgi:acetylornithine deacetylase/succinyl-diaminopimelate desuccinylase-like protein
MLDTRVLPGGMAEVTAALRELLGPRVRYEVVTQADPVQAPFDSPWFAAMADALQAGDPHAVVVPYCLGRGTDAKAFTRLGIPCYGFAPLGPAPDGDGYDHRAMAHAVDERVPIGAAWSSAPGCSTASCSTSDRGSGRALGDR